jgi:hypothetical protein
VGTSSRAPTCLSWRGRAADLAVVEPAILDLEVAAMPFLWNRRRMDPFPVQMPPAREVDIMPWIRGLLLPLGVGHLHGDVEVFALVASLLA